MHLPLLLSPAINNEFDAYKNNKIFPPE
jgi:hypothetical protein